MPTIGPTELVVILVIVLFVFGAGKLADVGKGLGRSVRELREATRDDVTGRLGDGETGRVGE